MPLEKILQENEQRAALQEGLIAPGERFTLTPDQEKAIPELIRFFKEERGSACLVAPTGSGKTLVELRVAVAEAVRTRRPVVVLVPTRDLARQQLRYFVARLKGTPLYAAEIHGGIPPQVRQELLQAFQKGRIQIAVASALVLSDPLWKPFLEGAALLIVDDVNAYDPDEALKRLHDFHIPMLFATATPEPVKGFLQQKGAKEVVSMEGKPFEAPPTKIHRLKGRAGEKPVDQLERAKSFLERHIKSKGRIFVISRTRAEVPYLNRFLRAAYRVPVCMLHGEMADTRVMARRLERLGGKRPTATRIHMMQRFRESLPAILVATNLVGAGLDVPNADLVVVTDADSFGEAELEQLIGRVGRRNRPSEAVLVTGTHKPVQKKAARRR
ncbi:MAG: helicase-related protein [Bacteroidota bacterium]